MPRPSFYKLILPKVIHERRLRIPDNFVKKFGNDLTGVVRLGLPDGLVWRIGLIKADNKFWLHDGWQKFTERYTLNVGCLVIFRYEGNAVFNVNIFNLSASEINYQSSALIGKRYLAFEDVEDDDCMENWDSSTCVASDQPTATKTYHHHPPAMQNLLSDSKLNYINWGDGNHPLSKSGAISQVPDQFSRDVDVQYSATKYNSNLNEVEFYSPAGETQKTKKRGRKKLKVESNDEQKAAQGEDEDEADMRFRLYQSASARKRTVTAEERERAVNAAKAFEPSNPFCRVVLRPSYLYKGCIMHLPSTFVEQHLSGVSGFIKLQFFDGKQWPVRCRYRGGRAKLSQGWYEFAQENHLGEGDVCVFELLKSRDIVLKVTVFPVHENPGFMTLNRPAR